MRDDAAGRYKLAREFYRLATGPRRRYGHAELSFMHWSLARGVLEPESSDPPGSPWWRAVNERLLRDKTEAHLLSAGATGTPSARSVEYWVDFIRTPEPGRWYRAHNASIVAGYVQHQDLAAAETQVERFMLNVALLRVLFTHAMLARPRLALGRSFPPEYPVIETVEETILDEHAFARMLDYGLIAPRLTALYEFSAASLDQPQLTSLLDDGVPAYAWPHKDRPLWYIGNTGPHLRAIARASGVRLLWEPSPPARSHRRAHR
ncbi:MULTISPECIES: hypothetical protein [unclassified Streptomyces]|uniref:hypothetical protein n=1 Tax=unclassified Streptomyces TaxID=2593676 RepID=UPI002DD966CB|nr:MULTISPECIES: hypothetical protein [unclassified Streptomyces]WSC41239.1 hypothetical protein OHA08_40440 [Streptomyces sp. NBC_01763]WSC51615.1 hypothetical protein OG808_04485 [Streptomyces sp. NBC_01761]WSF82465.1 hypothetical protein OIE70_04620 [Streptomyces sp. NBC_01744]